MTTRYDLSWLQTLVARGKRQKYVFFWGHRKPKSGEVTKSCFSQWYGASFKVERERFATAEHWMMAEKAALFDPGPIRQEIIRADNPGKAKALGRQVKGFDPKVWNAKKFDIVVEGNYHKFSQNDDLKAFLLATKNRVLVEASPVDPIWGIGLDEHDTRAQNPLQWKGQNLLGFALMVVRDRLA